jgi:hypothetical protein
VSLLRWRCRSNRGSVGIIDGAPASETALRSKWLLLACLAAG